jgi:hypothetical protein
MLLGSPSTSDIKASSSPSIAKSYKKIEALPNECVFVAMTFNLFKNLISALAPGLTPWPITDDKHGPSKQPLILNPHHFEPRYH